MSMDLEHRIRERAYAIWEAEGRVAGREHQHWARAEEEILAAAHPVTLTAKRSKPVKADAALRVSPVATRRRSATKPRALHS